ncbi:MAG TPA: dihydroorotate dehydrogenase-like protein [Gemmatimonadales bacterium]|nr:dihydroorotate dehydrogenase-like protein [Gemmatimonadales bacterium]
MPDLGTEYLGLTLPNPIVASSSPLAERIDELRRLEDAGVSAVVLHSLFEEQINLESHDLENYLTHGADSYQEASSYFPELSAAMGPESYLEHLARAKKALRIPVIASLNGASPGGWTRYARRMEDAGADALELNVYFVPTDPAMTSAAVERMYLELVQDITSSVAIPVAVKLTPFFSAPVHMATELAAMGAKGLVLFNRFYQPDIDLENLEVVPTLALSSPWTLRMRLRWVAIMYGHVAADLAVTGGVHSAEDVIKSMMVGARVAMMTSAVLKHGPGHVTKVLDDMAAWMEAHEYDSVRQMRGSMSHRAVAEPAAFERANYMKVLRSYALKGDRRS